MGSIIKDGKVTPKLLILCNYLNLLPSRLTSALGSEIIRDVDFYLFITVISPV